MNIKQIKAMTKEELTQEYKQLYEIVYLFETYGKRDILLLNLIETEIKFRGGFITPPNIIFQKD